MRISRRNFLASAGMVSLGLVTGLKAAEEKKPPLNVIYINIDDWGWTDCGFMGSSYYDTPNIDKLASDGMYFTNAYTPAANCAPSRASVFSGQYTPRHGIYTVGTSARGKSNTRKLIPIENNNFLSEENETFASVFQRAGYTTCHVGKWHISDDPTKHGFEINIGGNTAGSPKSYFAHAPYLNQSHNIPPQTPYNGMAAQIPGTIEAENFDNGGQFISYHDTTIGNRDGEYRNTDVDIQTNGTTDYKIVYADPAEWLEYTVQVSYSGRYDLHIQTATINADKTVHLECDGVDVTGTVAVPITANWNMWHTVVVPYLHLTAGNHIFRFVFDTGKVNLNNFSLLPNPDINADGVINFNDLIVLSSFWLDADCQFGDLCQKADLSFDYAIDMHDFARMAQSYNKPIN